MTCFLFKYNTFQGLVSDEALLEFTNWSSNDKYNKWSTTLQFITWFTINGCFCHQQHNQLKNSHGNNVLNKPPKIHKELQTFYKLQKHIHCIVITTL